RESLRRALAPANLVAVIIDDKVLITSQDQAHHKQLRQPVSVDFTETALKDALKQLSRQTATNIVLDPTLAKEGAKTVTLQLDEPPLEAAVKLAATSADLVSVRLTNVIYVTTEARAKQLRIDAVELNAPAPNPGAVNLG